MEIGKAFGPGGMTLQDGLQALVCSFQNQDGSQVPRVVTSRCLPLMPLTSGKGG